MRTCAPFLYPGNGWTDCAEIWYVVRDLLDKRFAGVNGGIYVHMCTCAPLFPYLRNGWMDGGENCCAIRELLAIHFAKDGDLLWRTCKCTHI